MVIEMRNDIRKLSETTIFSYREVYVLAMFEEAELLKTVLDIIVFSGMSVGMYLIMKGIPQPLVYKLLNEPVVYKKHWH